MGISVYYSCKRTKPFSKQEQQLVNTVIEKYNDSFRLKDFGESFCVYDSNEAEPVVIFEGSTKLPFSDDFEDMLDAMYHWLSCLTEIRRVVKEGEWHVHVDDTDAIWDDEGGWQMPSQ